MKKIIVFCLVIICLGCTGRQRSTSADENLEGDISVVIGQEVRSRNRDDRGIIYITTVNADRVNLHFHPTTQSNIRRRIPIDTKIRVVGISNEKDTIDGYTGHWLQAQVGDDLSWANGWVFSRFVNIGNITPNELRIIGLAPEEPGQARRLNGFFMKDNTKFQFSVRALQQANQPFWTFVWNYLNMGFRFDTTPGSYAWFPETGELRHITYLGMDGTVSRVGFTDDFNYSLSFMGRQTFTGLSNVIIRRINNNVVFHGSYLDNIRLDAYNNIEIASPITRRTITWLDEEIINFAETFRQNNPPPTDMVQQAIKINRDIVLIVISEHNIDTGNRRILRGEYIFTHFDDD